MDTILAGSAANFKMGWPDGYSPAPDNMLNRDLSAGAPNEKWLTEITEF